MQGQEQGVGFLCARPGINPNSSGYGMLYVLYFVLLPLGTIALVSSLFTNRGGEVSDVGGSSPALGGVPGDDSRLTVHIRIALRQHPDTAQLLPYIKVTVEQGVVTLTGQVSSEDQRALAESVTRQAVPTGEIINQLVVAAGPAAGSCVEPSRDAD